MTDQDKKWDFDRYDWLDRYDQEIWKHQYMHYDETLSRIIEKSSVRDSDVILDIGTGTGNLAIKFLEKGCEVIGLDPSARMLEMAESKAEKWQGKYKTYLCENPFVGIPFPGQTFDTIVATFSIHHVNDDEKRLSVMEMKRVSKTDGQIIIGDFMFKDQADKLRALAEYDDMEEEYHPMLDTFPTMFKDEGFRVEIEQVGDIVYIVHASLE
ncbi:class I SAM-dependent methyltransferase [Chloroflexota bacterium]